MKIDDYTSQELEAEIKRRKEKESQEENLNNPKTQKFMEKSPIGYWDVSTEGDCEGKSLKHLGLFFGHVADIAASLAKKCYYRLWFKEGKDPNILPYPQTKNETDIMLDIDSGTWDLSKETRVLAFEKFLSSKNSVSQFEVKKSNTYASVKIEFK